jgi:hypothetical protein
MRELHLPLAPSARSGTSWAAAGGNSSPAPDLEHRIRWPRSPRPCGNPEARESQAGRTRARDDDRPLERLRRERCESASVNASRSVRINARNSAQCTGVLLACGWLDCHVFAVEPERDARAYALTVTGRKRQATSLRHLRGLPPRVSSMRRPCSTTDGQPAASEHPRRTGERGGFSVRGMRAGSSLAQISCAFPAAGSGICSPTADLRARDVHPAGRCALRFPAEVRRLDRKPPKEPCVNRDASATRTGSVRVPSPLSS